MSARSDGFVYLGSGLQSVSLGYLTTKNWIFWPIFMAPFAFAELILALRIWKDLPEATKRYLIHVEQTRIANIHGHTVITHSQSDIEIIPGKPPRPS